jgi:hypothetical protein
MNWHQNQEGIFTSESLHRVSYPEDGNRNLEDIESLSPWFNQRNALILHFLKKYRSNGDFLDIGAGNGFQAKAIQDAGLFKRVIVCEPGYQGCVSARKKGLEHVYQGLFQQLPFSSFEVSSCGLFDVIEHVENDIQFLNELHAFLPKNSYVFINVPAWMHLWTQTDVFAGHFRRYNRSDIKRIESLTPFTCIASTFYFKHYYLPMLLLRVIPYKLGKRQSDEALLQNEMNNLKPKEGFIDKYLNIQHKHAMKQLDKGHTFTYGTSLFMVLKS